MTLKPSTEGMVQLTFEIVKNLQSLEQLHLRVKGTSLLVPGNLQTAMNHVHRLAKRHMEGDFRNTDDECIALKEIGQWSLDVNCELRNQPRTTIQWNS